MTKKHFIALADLIRDFRIPDGYANTSGNTLCFMIEALADFCQEQNPRFNRDRWLGYIAGTNGRNGGKVKV